ncbi:MAG: hypothetical protein IPL03_15170 [Sterolibacteriaceae bacterium]|nr:hypothetical protein [Candidatus Methylophosphatis haderslevensis]
MLKPDFSACPAAAGVGAPSSAAGGAPAAAEPAGCAPDAPAERVTLTGGGVVEHATIVRLKQSASRQASPRKHRFIVTSESDLRRPDAKRPAPAEFTFSIA